MNRSTLRSLVLNLCEDPNQTRYTAAQVNEALDRATEEFGMDSRCFFKTASTYTVVSGTSNYSLPSDFWYPKLVTHKGLELLPITRDELVKDNGDDWTDDAGTPRHYIIDPEEASKYLKLYPIPQGDDAGDNLVLSYYAIAPAMTADSQSPFNSSTLLAFTHLGIAHWAAWLLLGYGTQTPEIIMKRNSMLDTYSKKVTEAVDRFGTTKNAPMRIRTIRG